MGVAADRVKMGEGERVPAAEAVTENGAVGVAFVDADGDAVDEPTGQVVGVRPPEAVFDAVDEPTGQVVGVRPPEADSEGLLEKLA